MASSDDPNVPPDGTAPDTIVPHATPPSYRTLIDRGAREWIIEGPNSGGVVGLVMHDGLIWWFRADWTPVVEGPPMTAAEFLDRYGDLDRRGFRELAAHLRGG